MRNFLGLLRTDYVTLYGVCSFPRYVFHNFFNGGHPIRYITWFRIANYFKRKNKFLFLLSWFRLRHYEFKYGVHTSTDLKVGSHFCIAHGDCVYIYAESIGNHFTVFQGVTIGRNQNGIPVIGDNVTVYTGATIVGPVIIGNNSVIAAGSVVIHDVPEGALVAGVPAHVVKYI